MTPTPWRMIDLRHQKGGQIRITSAARGHYHWIANVMAIGPNASEDAAFLIRAVNCHEELLAACREAIAAFEWGDPFNETDFTEEERIEEAKRIINAAIAKAVSP